MAAMKLTALLALFACASLVQGCSHVFTGPHRTLLAEKEGAKKEGAHWNYNSAGADWAGTCKEGKAQSPIAIVTDAAADMPEVARAQLDFGKLKGLNIINTGHGIQIEWDSLEGVNATVPVRGEEWGAIYDDGAKGLAGAKDVRQVPIKPLQAHWHSTSEHLVDGAMSPLELHIVTLVDNTTGAWVPEKCKTDKCLAVFGVMVNFLADPSAKGSEFYQTIVEKLPTETGAEKAIKLSDVELDLNSLLPADLSYFTYPGSLTTPPCSEGVQWHVFVAPKAELSAAQLDAFQVALATVKESGTELGARTTNRPVQPLNGRPVLFSEGASASA